MFVFWCLLYWCLLSGLWSFKEDLVRARRVQPHTAATAATAATGITWPPAIRVESVSPSAPVPPAYICPITMGPMANPAITPRGTSYDREALCDWIAKEHRYPGGEVRAVVHESHTSARHRTARPLSPGCPARAPYVRRAPRNA